MSTQVQWLTPSPLWKELSSGSDQSPFRSPAILRFTSDDFMPELQNVLQQNPQTLRNYVAQGENWRAPAAGLDKAGTGLPLKLYQPAQARFYLVASSLTCRIPGLPDHTVDRGQGENAVFVVRQLRPNPGFSAADGAVFDPARVSEYAWIPGEPPGWVKVTSSELVPGEEQLPLSPAQAKDPAVTNGGMRRVLTGLIPASRKQQYAAGRTLSNGNGNGTPQDPRADLFSRTVIQPWAALSSWWASLDNATRLDPQYVASAQQSSALILLDFANFLQSNIPKVWAAVGGSSPSDSGGPETTLYNALPASVDKALLNAKQFEQQLEGPASDKWPPAGYVPFSLAVDADTVDPTALLAPLTAALPPAKSSAALPPLAQKPANPRGDFYFIVRCAYVRPQCEHTVISQPSQPFQLASYFDSDAPARRIQVALPIDTSPAALRKYDKGVAFLISSELQNQMSRVKSLKDMSDGTIGPEGLDIGFICSFSIPIITICALILLLVLVIALNLVFFWIPFFKICLPVPALKGE